MQVMESVSEGMKTSHTYMVCTQGEVKVNQHRAVCDHQERPRTWKGKNKFPSNQTFRDAFGFSVGKCKALTTS